MGGNHMSVMLSFMDLFNKKTLEHTVSSKIEDFLCAKGFDSEACKSPKGYYGVSLTEPINAKLFFHILSNGVRIQVVPTGMKYYVSKTVVIDTSIGPVTVTPGETNPYIIVELDTVKISNNSLDDITGYIFGNMHNLLKSAINA